MNVIFYLLLIFCFSALTTYAADCPTDRKAVFCYYSNWAIYRPSDGAFTPKDIDPELCTHLVYAFAGLSIYGGIESFDPNSDLTRGGYADFVGLKEKNPCLKTLLAIGGWNQGSKKYSVVQMVSDREYREDFIGSVLRFLAEYDFDGLDIDWEYPAERGGIPADKENFGLLMKELKEALGKWNMLLTIAVPISISVANLAYDMDAVKQYVDYVFIMGYDYTSTYSTVTGLLSPFTPIKETIEFWSAKIPSTKVVLGVPAYGRTFKLSDSSKTGLGAPTDGPGEPGTYTQEAGFLNYFEIMSKAQSGLYKIVSVPNEQNFYAYYKNDWIVYETAQNLQAKAKYALDKKLGGMMVWAIDSDDFAGHLNSSFAVVKTIKNALN